MAEKDINTKILISGFITLLLGAIVTGIIADEIQTKTTQTTILNETINITSARLAGGNINTTPVFTIAQAPDDDCAVVLTRYGNESTAFTDDTDFTFTESNGQLSLLNTTTLIQSNQALNSTRIDYKYCGTGYLQQGWSRTTLNTVAGLFAIALLLAGVWLFYAMYRKFESD